MSKPANGTETARNQGRHRRTRRPATIMGSSTRPSITPRPCCTPRWRRWKTARQPYSYGRRKTPTIEALENAICELEGGAGTVLCPSGLQACTLALLSVASAGDHILVTDSVYGPTRTFCDKTLSRFGVTTTYFDPLIGGGIASLFKPNTRAVFLESPGSLTFEIQDVPAIAAAARAQGHRRHPRQHLGDAVLLRRARPRRRHRA